MSTRIMSEYWNVVTNPAAKAVLISLADQANDARECWPSVHSLCVRTCLSERSVRRALRGLASDGLLKLQFRSGRSTVYLLVDPGHCDPCQSGTPVTVAPTPVTVTPPTPVTVTPRTKSIEPSITVTLVEPAKKARKFDPRPLLTLFAEKLPMLPQPDPARLSPARRRALAARWHDSFDENLATWGDYLDRVAESGFLTGRIPPAPGHTRWRCDLDFLLRPAKIQSIAEGKYDD